MSPTMRGWTWPGRFVPIVDLTQDDEDRNSRMSDIPLQLPVSATAVSKCIGDVLTS